MKTSDLRDPRDPRYRYDEAFAAIEGLKWDPWVGSNYNRNNQPPLLIVGESHYFGKQLTETEEQKRIDHRVHRPLTREVVRDHGVGGVDNKAKNQRTYRNLERVLLGAVPKDRTHFWNEVAYMNFIQEPMFWDAKKRQRPSPQHFVEAWHGFSRVLGVLKPRLCLFVGVGAAKYLALQKQKLELGDVAHFQVGRNWAHRVTGRSPGGAETEIIFIQHLGARFCSWSAWRGFLQKENPALIKRFEQAPFLNSGGIG